MIDGVIISNLRKIPDERGCILHMMRKDSASFTQFGEIYFSIAYPGVIKGWHEHTQQTQNYAVVQGMIKLVLFDNRVNSKTYKETMEIFTGELNYQLITIPPGVVNGYKCIGTEQCLVANCSDLPYQDGEMIRYDPLSSFIDYNWDLVMR